MTFKPGLILGWICAILVAAFNIFGAVAKLMPIEPGSESEKMVQALGINGMQTGLSVLEFAIVILFLIPRTSTIGFILMVGYTGGILATLLTHGFSSADAWMIYLSLALLTISAWFRNPELGSRLFGKPVPEKAL